MCAGSGTVPSWDGDGNELGPEPCRDCGGTGRADFCVFILTHGRPDKVFTFDTLRKSGYDGPIYIVIDNEDNRAEAYRQKFGPERVVMFDKKAVADRIDEFDNFNDRRAILYARNACFEIAERLGFKYFLQCDDDYPSFKFRMNDQFNLPKSCPNIQKTLGKVIYAMLKFYKSIQVASIAFAQGGDFIKDEKNFRKPPGRKCMNTFFCSTDRKFEFVGRINEDVNTYTWVQSRGPVFLTVPLIQVDQKQTQKTAGGMTEIYLNQGTYVKSFYSIICSPNCVTINMMGRTNRRFHHKVNWPVAVPVIVSEKWRKG